MSEAFFYDGKTAQRRKVDLRFHPTSVNILENAETIAVWPLAGIRLVEDKEGVLRLTLAQSSFPARLEVREETGRVAILSQCPNLNQGSPPEKTFKIVLWSLTAAASALLCIFILIPLFAERVTPYIPLSLEKRLGRSVDNQFRFLFSGKDCSSPEGDQALKALVERLQGAAPVPVMTEVGVFSSQVPNAFALPGGRIYIFEGLLKSARSTDEIAGVLAHEMGHVAHRDGLRSVLRDGSASFFIGLILGDVAGGGTLTLLGQTLVSGVYSRDAERAADSFAADIMTALGHSAKPVGELLQRIENGQFKMPTILSTHPLTEERLEALSARPPSHPGEPLLSESEWKALKAICTSG